MNSFIKNYLNEFKNRYFLYPEIELRSLLNFSSKKNEDIFFNNFEINKIDLIKFDSIFKRRICHEPISKIFNNKEFWSYDFYVNKDVLDPRPESEFLIDAAKKYFFDFNKNLNICDLGTGTGCLAIVLAKIFKNSKVFATDVSIEALRVAKINSKKHGTRHQIKFINCDWISEIRKFDLIVSNPPYLSYKEYRNCQADIKFYEPKIALVAGEDGLNAYRKIAAISSKIMHLNSFLFIEIGKNQKNKVLNIFRNYNINNIEIIKDYQSIDRVLVMKRI